MADENVNLFVYGTLMDKSRLNSIIKRVPEMHPAKVSASGSSMTTASDSRALKRMTAVTCGACC